MLAEKPDIVVGTPTRVLAHIRAGNLSIKETLELLIVDEADIVFSFGYELDVKGIIEYVYRMVQRMMIITTIRSLGLALL